MKGMKHRTIIIGAKRKPLGQIYRINITFLCTFYVGKVSWFLAKSIESFWHDRISNVMNNFSYSKKFTKYVKAFLTGSSRKRRSGWSLFMDIAYNALSFYLFIRSVLRPRRKNQP